MASRIVVDEGVGSDSDLWKQFQRVFDNRDFQYAFLNQLHPGIPDVEILEKVLQSSDILLTKDSVLHQHALARGIRSYTLNERGELTRKRLAGVRTSPLPSSAHQELQTSYHHQPDTNITRGLKADLREKQFKRYRTARRRIRSHFGSSAAIDQVSITVGTAITSSGVLYGYEFNISGTSGVSGLRANEGYCQPAGSKSNPVDPVMHALRAQFLLQLEQVRTELFIIPEPSLELSRQLLGAAVREVPEQEALRRLLTAVSRLTLQPCVKGRFFDRMRCKLKQLQRSRSNEVTTVDFARLTEQLLSDTDDRSPLVSNQATNER